MFPLCVKEELEFWPEKNNRQRKWVCLRATFFHILSDTFDLLCIDQKYYAIADILLPPSVLFRWVWHKQEIVASIGG